MPRRTYTSLPPAENIELHAALKARLTRLSYKALALCVERLLEELGFSGIRTLGREHLKGRTRFGGADLYANATGSLGPRPVLIQIKPTTRPVPRHYVDELRGVLLRYGIPQGLVVTTSTFSRPARIAANGYRGRPIRLIDGDELTQLLITHTIGVRLKQDILSKEQTWVVDDEAFGFLRTFAFKRSMRERKERHARRGA